MNRNVNRLVILAPNWLGDAVMALPAIGDVRRAFPDATITAAARPSIAPLFALVPEVNDTIVLSRTASMMSPSSWQELGAEIGGGRFDAALLLPNSIHAALIAHRAGVADIWGYRANWRGRLLTRAVAPPSGLHQVAYYQHLVHALGCANGSAAPAVTVSAAARQAARPRARRRRLGRPCTARGHGTWRGVRRRQEVAVGIVRRAGDVAGERWHLHRDGGKRRRCADRPRR